VSAPLGRDFGRLWAAAGVSNVGDGVYATALPLLAATLTRDPFRVSLVMFAEWLPWLVFGLVSGALVDRWDRRRVMWSVDALRCAVVAALAGAVLAGWASIPLLMATGFLLGTGQTLVDTAAVSAVPALVSRDPARLDRANGRLQGTQIAAGQFAGPPGGGFLFSLASWSPFLVDALSFAASSALVGSIRHAVSSHAEAAARTSLRAEIRDGLRWLGRHRLLRTLAALVAVVNLLHSGTDAVLVLFANDKLGLGSVGYGLLLSGAAVGGLAGSLSAAWVGRRLGAATILVGGLLLGGVATAAAGLSSAPWVAGVLLGVSWMSTGVFNVVAGSLRQRLVPDPLLGRVVSAFRLLGYGAVPLGAVLGGVVASGFGLRAPFVLAGAVVPLAALAAIPIVNAHTVAQAQTEADADAARS
jgi:MFS family permease